jgi:hypothetical protein
MQILKQGGPIDGNIYYGRKGIPERRRNAGESLHVEMEAMEQSQAGAQVSILHTLRTHKTFGYNDVCVEEGKSQ